MNTHYAHTLGRNRYAYLTAGRNWYVISKSSLQQVDQNFEVMHCHCSNDITCKYFVYFYLTLLYQMRKFRSFVINVSLVPVTVPEEGDRQFAKRCSSHFTYTVPCFSHSTHFSGCLRMRGRRVHGMCAPLYFIKFLLVPCLIYKFTGRKM